MTLRHFPISDRIRERYTWDRQFGLARYRFSVFPHPRGGWLSCEVHRYVVADLGSDSYWEPYRVFWNREET